MWLVEGDIVIGVDGRTVHPRPAYSGGLQPPPTELEKFCN